MRIQVTGGTKKQRELSTSIARFTANQLMSKRLQKNIYVEKKQLILKKSVYKQWIKLTI